MKKLLGKIFSDMKSSPKASFRKKFDGFFQELFAIFRLTRLSEW
jgi:hypothetical protein